MSEFDFDVDSFDENLFLLIAGLSGTGKTTALRSLLDQVFKGKDEYGRDQWTQAVRPPEGQGIIAIATEKGFLSVLDLVVPKKDKTGTIIEQPMVKAVKVNSIESMYRLFDILNNPKTQEKYKTVFFDGWTETSAEVYGDTRKKTDKDGIKYNKQYEAYRFQFQNLIRTFRDLPHYNKFTTCITTPTQVNKLDSEYGVSFELYCNGQADSVDTMKQHFDGVLQIKPEVVDDDGNRMFKVAPSSEFDITKDRSGMCLPFEKFRLKTIASKMLRLF